MLDICLTLSISVFSLCWWPDSLLFKWMHFFVHDKSWLNYFSQLERITITCCTVVLVCCVLHPKKHHHSSSKKQPKQELIQSENKTSSWKVSKTKCLMSGFPPPGWSVGRHGQVSGWDTEGRRQKCEGPQPGQRKLGTKLEINHKWR